MISFSDRLQATAEIEKRLIDSTLTFQETFLAIQQIRSHVSDFPGSVTRQTVHAVFKVLESDRFVRQKQSYFLFYDTCRLLILIVELSPREAARDILPKMQEMLIAGSGKRHRAIAQSFTCLPLQLKCPDIPCRLNDKIYTISFADLACRLHIKDPLRMIWKGRSLIGRTFTGKTAVVKFLKTDDIPAQILKEIFWMDYFIQNPPDPVYQFEVPTPFKIHEYALFQISGLPTLADEPSRLSMTGHGIAFTAPDNYFDYPNEPSVHCIEKTRPVTDIFKNNAALLGKLTGTGIIHTALIPLFHNRIQRQRRTDRGYYLWEHGGRLDQWLESCRYPNFSASGLRDFEHFECLENIQNLQHYIGTHLLSFILVAGSYFRNKNPLEKGHAPNGQPVDTRDLFDKFLFSDILKTAIAAYCKELSGVGFVVDEKLISETFVVNLIEKMGIDNDMEEHLRVRDQNDMEMDVFQAFIAHRSHALPSNQSFVKGERDITLLTGPHLGGFNQRISVPELIDLIFTISALCIADRYAMENGLKPLEK